MSAGNSVFREQQLLGGILENTVALRIDRGDVVFSGTDAIAGTNVGVVDLISVGVTGAETLGLGSTIHEVSSLNAALDRSTRLLGLRGGRGVEPGLIRISGGGNFVEVNLRSPSSLGDIVVVIGDHPLNQDPLRVIPSLNPLGNGIQLLAPPDAEPITVRRGAVSNAAELLGFMAKGQDVAVGVIDGSFASLTGSDYARKEAGGTIDTLIRLEAAGRVGDVREIERLQNLVDSGFNKATSARGRIGIWSQNVQVMQASADEQAIALKSELSIEIDADFATVISDLTQRQTSLEASLKMICQTARLSLLDFL